MAVGACPATIVMRIGRLSGASVGTEFVADAVRATVAAAGCEPSSSTAAWITQPRTAAPSSAITNRSRLGRRTRIVDSSSRGTSRECRKVPVPITSHVRAVPEAQPRTESGFPAPRPNGRHLRAPARRETAMSSEGRARPSPSAGGRRWEMRGGRARLELRAVALQRAPGSDSPSTEEARRCPPSAPGRSDAHDGARSPAVRRALGSDADTTADDSTDPRAQPHPRARIAATTCSRTDARAASTRPRRRPSNPTRSTRRDDVDLPAYAEPCGAQRAHSSADVTNVPSQQLARVQIRDDRQEPVIIGDSGSCNFLRMLFTCFSTVPSVTKSRRAMPEFG